MQVSVDTTRSELLSESGKKEDLEFLWYSEHSVGGVASRALDALSFSSSQVLACSL